MSGLDHLPNERCLAYLPWSGNGLDKAPRLAQPATENRSLRPDKAHDPPLLNLMSIFTQYVEQMQRAQCRRLAVKARDLERQKELGKRRAGLITARTLRSTKGKLAQGYRGDPHLSD